MVNDATHHTFLGSLLECLLTPAYLEFTHFGTVPSTLGKHCHILYSIICISRSFFFCPFFMFHGYPVIYGLMIRSGKVKTCTARYPNSSCGFTINVLLSVFGHTMYSAHINFTSPYTAF